jgi:hypothetical protein
LPGDFQDSVGVAQIARAAHSRWAGIL